MTTDDDGGGLLDCNDKISTGEKPTRDGNNSADDDDDWVSTQIYLYLLIVLSIIEKFQNLLPIVRTRLLFPNLSMLDVSNNLLKCIPPTIHELSNLSVLNISGNTGNFFVSFFPFQIIMYIDFLCRNWRTATTNGSSKPVVESKHFRLSFTRTIKIHDRFEEI